MRRYQIRKLQSSDFPELMRLEEEIFGPNEDVLGPYYVRLCCDFYFDSCFIAHVGNDPVGYVLCFIKEREAYCTTLAVLPQYQGTRVVHCLLQALAQVLIEKVDSCWFTVKPDNAVARSIHGLLGAKETGVRTDFYGPGDQRISSRIDREVLVRLRDRYQRLGLLGEAKSREDTYLTESHGVSEHVSAKVV